MRLLECPVQRCWRKSKHNPLDVEDDCAAERLLSCFILLQWKNIVHLFGFSYEDEDMLLHLFVFLSPFIGLRAADKISPRIKEVSESEGRSVTLSCDYETTEDYVLLLWYRHDSDLQAPQFLLSKGARSRGGDGRANPDKRYGSKTTRSSTEMTIRELTLADSAVYYCALHPEDMGPYRYTFGEAITLSVRPRDQSLVQPSLFVLSPLGPGGCLGHRGPAVCLAAGFRPRVGEMVLNVVNREIPLNTGTAVMSPKHKTFFFAGFNNGTISSCEMNNVTSSDNPVESCDGFDSETVESCENFDSETIRFNSYLLLLNAARVMFTKAVAFSSVLTIRALLA